MGDNSMRKMVNYRSHPLPKGKTLIVSSEYELIIEK